MYKNILMLIIEIPHTNRVQKQLNAKILDTFMYSPTHPRKYTKWDEFEFLSTLEMK